MNTLTTNLAGLTLRNPILTAAGPMARDGSTLLEAAKGGVGGLVAKTISLKPAEVPRPNMAVLNRRRTVGLLNTELWSDIPANQWLHTEYKKAKQTGLPLIGSVGYTPEEVAELAPQMVAAGCDAIEFSVHYVKKVDQIAKSLSEVVEVPLFAKLSPHSSEDLAKLARNIERYVDGFTAINTLGPTLHIDIETGRPFLGNYGWMSGPALKPLAIRCVVDICKSVKKPVIGVGGISTGADVVEYLMAGATAVQVCTQAILRGHTIYGKLAQKVEVWLKQHGYDSVEAIKGCALKHLPSIVSKDQAIPVIDHEACNLCRICVGTCVYDALTIHENVLQLNAEKCYGCGLCTSICPQYAIAFQEKVWSG
ncbi:MAG: 4Fe-4S binding protein [Candidatus Heimdallarchaeota archaeon]